VYTNGSTVTARVSITLHPDGTWTMDDQ
jgi:hypothetical protein